MGLLQEATCEFAAFVMSEACSDISKPETQTVGPERILAAMRNLNFSCYFSALEAVRTTTTEHEPDLLPFAQMKQRKEKKRKADSTIAEMLNQSDTKNAEAQRDEPLQHKRYNEFSPCQDILTDLEDLEDDEWASVISRLLADSQSSQSTYAP